MSKANGRVGFVYMLSALSTGTVGIYTEVFRLNVNFNCIIQNRININRSKAGMTAGICIKRRNADQAVNTTLTLEITVNKVSAYLNCNRFDSAFCFQLVYNLCFVAMAFCPS